jgi:hypothetical protein
METAELLFGRNIAWDELKMWRVRHFTSLARVVAGRVSSVGAAQPYGLLTVETPKLSGLVTALVPVGHRIDFTNVWSIYNERGLEADEDLLVSFCPPRNGLLRLLSSVLPRLMFQIFSAGNLERRIGLSGDVMDAIAANSEEPRHIVCPRTSLI